MTDLTATAMRMEAEVADLQRAAQRYVDEAAVLAHLADDVIRAEYRRRQAARAAAGQRTTAKPTACPRCAAQHPTARAARACPCPRRKPGPRSADTMPDATPLITGEMTEHGVLFSVPRRCILRSIVSGQSIRALASPVVLLPGRQYRWTTDGADVRFEEVARRKPGPKPVSAARSE